MKNLVVLVFAVTALLAHAAPLSFVQIGHAYRVQNATGSLSVVVVADLDGGWYKCLERSGASSAVNFNLATQISPLDEPSVAGPIAPTVTPPTPSIRQAVMNNLRLLSAAADQFYLENGVAEAKWSDLVGPTKYVRQVTPIDGEDYTKVVFRLGKGLSITTRTGIAVTYGP